MLQLFKKLKYEDSGKLNRQVKWLALLVVAGAASFGCIADKGVKLKYQGLYQIPASTAFQNTKVGGLSGIDYDPVKNCNYLISDDRLEHNPARFYTATIKLSENKIDTVVLNAVTELRDSDNMCFEKEYSDTESIRYMKGENRFYIADEGGKLGHAGIKIFDIKGKYIKDLKIDSTVLNHVRFNKSFESIDFSPDGKDLFYATETALTIDGAESTFDKGSTTRIIKCNIADGSTTGESIYAIEKIPLRALGASQNNNKVADNGVAELLVLGKKKLLMLERSGFKQPDGSFIYICKIFECFIKSGKTLKKLLFDSSILPFEPYCIEGMTLGPKMNGKQTLILVTDNNFTDPTCFYLFTILK